MKLSGWVFALLFCSMPLAQAQTCNFDGSVDNILRVLTNNGEIPVAGQGVCTMVDHGIINDALATALSTRRHKERELRAPTPKQTERNLATVYQCCMACHVIGWLPEQCFAYIYSQWCDYDHEECYDIYGSQRQLEEDSNKPAMTLLSSVEYHQGDRRLIGVSAVEVNATVATLMETLPPFPEFSANITNLEDQLSGMSNSSSPEYQQLEIQLGDLNDDLGQCETNLHNRVEIVMNDCEAEIGATIAEVEELIATGGSNEIIDLACRLHLMQHLLAECFLSVTP